MEINVQQQPADRLRLRRDLVCHTQRPDASGFVLEDPIRKRFFRLGTNEQFYVEQLLEGVDSQQATLRLRETLGDDTWTDLQSSEMNDWLATQGLLEQSALSQTAPADQAPVVAKAYFWRISLWNPDRFLQRINQSVGWLFDWKCSVAGVLLLLVALACMSGHWPAFIACYENLFVAQRWLMIAVAWFALKIIHEVAHGVTCRRYGCEVPDCGIALILFMPIAFVDVSSSWRLAKWQRLHVTLAGIATELAIAGVALFVWMNASSLVVQQVAADVVMLASVSSLLFNLNPLLKFDGYFALADATEIDNLYDHGRNYARYFGGRYLLGLNVESPELPPSRCSWVKWYGVSAACYRMLTVTGLMVAAAAMFQGAGIVIALAGGFLFVVAPLTRLGKWLTTLFRKGQLRVSRLIIRLVLCTVPGLAILFVLPADWTFTTPAVVEYDPPAVLRAPVNGFLEAVHVRDGQYVETGQPLMTFRNEELTLDWLELQKQILVTKQEVQMARFRQDFARLNESEATLQGLESQRRELKNKRAGLIVRAPVAGRLVARGLHLKEGCYVEEAAELGVIGNEASKRLKLSIELTDAKQLAEESTCEVIAPSLDSFRAKVSRLESRATDRLAHPSLSATNGGPLAVMEDDGGDLHLSQPRLTGFIRMTPEQSRPLRSGQRVSVKLATSHESLGQWLLSRWR